MVRVGHIEYVAVIIDKIKDKPSRVSVETVKLILT